jgi:LPS-assembly protein
MTGDGARLAWALLALFAFAWQAWPSADTQAAPEQQPPAAAQHGQERFTSYTVRGEHVTQEGASGKWVAENASLLSGGIEVSAARLEFDPQSGDATASGRVRVTQGDRLLTGEQARYNLRNRKGRLLQASALVEGVHFTGKVIEIEPQRLAVFSGSFTTCDRPKPHYEMKARRLELLGGRRVLASGVSLWFRGKRILTLPTINQPIPGRGGIPTGALLPRSGWTRADGGFVGLRYAFPLADMAGSVETRLTTSRGLRFLSGLRRDTKLGELALVANMKEDLADLPISVDRIETGLRRITVDRVPELSLEIPQRNLGKYVRTSALLLAGRYRENPSGVSAERLAGSARFSTKPLRFGRYYLVQACTFRKAFYTRGMDQTVVLSRTGLGIRFSPSVRTEIAWERRTSSGESPFLFDQVEIPRGVTADALVRLTHGWRVETGVLYDANREELRDLDIAVTRRAHCLEYSATWRKARGQFTFQVGLAPFR